MFKKILCWIGFHNLKEKEKIMDMKRQKTYQIYECKWCGWKLQHDKLNNQGRRL